MKMKTMKHHMAGVSVAMALTLMTVFTGCGSAQATGTDVEQETIETTDITDTKEEITDTKEEITEPGEITESEMSEETVEPEVTEEPAMEAVVYEGINMDSTLPGAEWVATFEGIIDEPKLVVFNDETNKKVILENEQEVDFSLTDKIVIYIPQGHNGGYIKNKGFIFSSNMNYNSSGRTVLDNLGSKYKVGDQVPLEVLLTYDDADLTLRATLNLVE